MKNLIPGIMKNFKKLSKRELKSIQGAIEKCYYLFDGTRVCPCNPHTTYNCNGVCIPLGQACAAPSIEL